MYWYPLAAAGIVIFALLHLYRSLWQFASITELRNIIAASVLASVANFVICEVSGNGMPRSCYIIFFLFSDHASGRKPVLLPAAAGFPAPEQ